LANLATGELPISDWNGLAVLQLQCASGEDTLSLALAGATITGVDIAAENIKHARRLLAADAARPNREPGEPSRSQP
jgi:2-polyprenyl-3-methyl-5-hydroxy-6-metoxy-1,4-benzoquinol methylase